MDDLVQASGASAQLGREPATVLIVTRNRREELVTALRSTVEQSLQPEVIVIDDASTDGTASQVAREFPHVRLFVGSSSRGYVTRRNQGVALATTPIVVSIDDDAYFASPETLSQAVAEFGHPRVGAVALPFVEVQRAEAKLQHAPSVDDRFVTWGYIGCANAVRRDLFLGLNGYRTSLVERDEEKDYCLRLLDAGYVTVLARGGLVHHVESPRRNTGLSTRYLARNRLLYAWYNVPTPHVVPHVLGAAAKNLARGARGGRLLDAAVGSGMGIVAIWRERHQRRPVSRDTYRLFRKLSLEGPLPLTAIAGRETAQQPARQ